MCWINAWLVRRHPRVGVAQTSSTSRLVRPCDGRRVRKSSRHRWGVRVLSGPTFDAPLEPGVYFLAAAGSRVGAVVVNPEPASPT